MSDASYLTGKARLAGVVGWPISHSRSPRLHGFWLRHYRIDGAYLPLAVPPKRLEQGLRALSVLGFRGVNVTLPHKERALAICDQLTQRALDIGAVNTVTVQDDGALLGDNTDGHGFLSNLKRGASQWRAAAAPAVLLGAGGAARAIAAALLGEGVLELRLCNRSIDRARALAVALGPGIKVVPWFERHAALEGAGLLVNSTSLGMQGQEGLEIDLRGLERRAVVTDIVYTPLETPLLAAARLRGHQVIDGLGMLLYQACPGFAAWFGIEPEVSPALRAVMLEP